MRMMLKICWRGYAKFSLSLNATSASIYRRREQGEKEAAEISLQSRRVHKLVGASSASAES